jgi:hypothetical protein
VKALSPILQLSPLGVLDVNSMMASSKVIWPLLGEHPDPNIGSSLNKATCESAINSRNFPGPWDKGCEQGPAGSRVGFPAEAKG